MNLWQSFSLWLPAAVSAAELHRLGLVVLHSLWQAVAVAAAVEHRRSPYHARL